MMVRWIRRHALTTQDSKLELWWSDTKHATSKKTEVPEAPHNLRVGGEETFLNPECHIDAGPALSQLWANVSFVLDKSTQ